MKLTVITADDGTVIGSMRTGGMHAMSQGGPMRGGLLAGPGQKIQEIDVPDDLAAIEDGEKLHKEVQKHLHKKTP
jgi:hypothetical protein